MKTDEELIWESYIVSESPYMIPTAFPEELNSSFENATREFIVKNGGKLYDTFNDIEIFVIPNPNDTQTQEYYFVRNEILIAYYRFVIKDDYIQTKMIWNSKNHREIFREIFLNYILPKYKKIQSDDQITERGFKFWEKILHSGGNFKIYVSDENTKKVKPIEDIRDIEEQKQKLNSSFKYTTFWILYGK